MEIKHITDDFAVSHQVTANDVSLVRAMGFRTIICNRPDGEDLSQALFEQIQAAGLVSQINTIYLPIALSGPTDQDIAEFQKVIDTAEKPVLAYCDTGQRSAALFNEVFPHSEIG